MVTLAHYFSSMRTALLASLLLLLAFAPKKDTHPDRFIYDNENVLDPDEEQQLDTLFRGHELRTTNEIVLITSQTYRGNPDIAAFAGTCGDSLKVGKKHASNGVVIVFSKAQHEAFIQPGLGLEGVLTEWKCRNIVDSVMLPLFKEKMYFDGLLMGSKAMVAMLEQPLVEIEKKP